MPKQTSDIVEHFKFILGKVACDEVTVGDTDHTQGDNLYTDIFRLQQYVLRLSPEAKLQIYTHF